MAVMSLVSFAVSILGFILYCSLFEGSGLGALFVIVALASVVLPPVSKKFRLAQNKKGKALEIISIVIAGFNFWCVCVIIARLPALIGYLGWVISGVAYRMVKPKAESEA